MNKIRELLEEEQNFEIVNYPTPPQYSMKKGHKKVKLYLLLCSSTHYVGNAPTTSEWGYGTATAACCKCFNCINKRKMHSLL